MTARAPAEAAPVAALTGMTGTAICCLGAVVCGFADASVHLAWPFPSRAAAELVARVRAAVPTVAFGWVDRIGPAREPDYPRRRANDEVRTARIDPLAGEVWHIFVRDAGRQPLPAARLRAVVAGLAEVSGYDNDPGLLEFTPPGVDKGTGLRRWCTDRRITADQVAAVGDTRADLPMLTWAGWGAAVGNAPPHVRAAADRVLPDNDSDGVALLLEQLTAGHLP